MRTIRDTPGNKPAPSSPYNAPSTGADPSAPSDLAWVARLGAAAATATSADALASEAVAVLSIAFPARLALWHADPVASDGWLTRAGENSTAPEDPPLRLLASTGLGQTYLRQANKAAATLDTAPLPAALAWRTRTALTLADPTGDDDDPLADELGPAWRKVARNERLGVGLVLPLLAGEGSPPLGVLEAYFPPGAPPDLLTRTGMQMAGAVLGAAFAQVGVQEQMGRRLAEALLLREISQMIGNSIELEETLAAVLRAVRRLIPYNSSELCLYDPTRQLLQTRAVAGEEGFVGQHWAEYGLDDGYTGWVATHGEALIVDDVAGRDYPQPASRHLSGGIEMRAYVGLPLLTPEPDGFVPPPADAPASPPQVLGTLEIASDRAYAFSANDVNLLQKVAEEAAVAISKAQAYRESREQLDRRLQELMVLQRVGRELNTTWDLDRLFDLVTREAVQATGADFATIIQADPAGRGYVSRSTYGLDQQFAAQLRETLVPSGTGIVGQVMRTGTGLLLNDVSTSPYYTELVPSTRSELVVPIRYEDQIVGVINLESKRLNGFDDNAVRFVEALADQAAVAIGNAQNFEAQVVQGEQLLSRANQLSQVLEIGNALIGEQPLEDVLDQIVHAVVDTSGFSTASMRVVSPDLSGSMELIAAAGMPLLEYADLRLVRRRAGETQEMLRPEFRLGRAYYIPEEAVHEDPQTRLFHITYPYPERGSNEWAAGDLLLLPLMSTTGEFLGTLDVDRPMNNQKPSRPAMETLEIFANQAALAIENAQLLGRYKLRIAEMSALNQLGQALASSLHLDAICVSVYEHVRQFIYCDAFYVALYDEGRHLITFPFAIDEGQRYTLGDSQLGEGLGSVVIQQGGPVLISDLQAEGPRFNSDGTLMDADAPDPEAPWFFGSEKPTRTWLGVPLTVGHKITGVISAQSYTAQAFRPEHVEFLSTAANQAAVALQNALLFNDRERRIGELATLNQIASELNSSLQLDQLLRLLFEQVRQIMNIRYFHIVLNHPERNELEFRFNFEEGQFRPAHTEPHAQGGLVSYVLDTRQPLLVQGDTNEFCVRMGIERVGIGAKCWLGMPMVAGDRVLGVIVVPSYTDEDAYDQDHVTLLSTVANQAAIALENAQLFQERERRINQLSILNEIAKDLTSTLDVYQLLERMLRHAQEATGAPFGGIFRYDMHRKVLRLSASNGYSSAMFEQDEVWAPDAGLVGRVFRTGEPLLVTDVHHEADYFEAEPGIQSELLVPIRKEDRVFGVVNLESPLPGAFDQDHLRFMEQLAAQTAIALENVYLFDEAQNRIMQLDALNELSSVLSSQLEPDMVFQTLYERVTDLFDPAAFYVGLVDRAQNKITFPFMIEHDQRIYNEELELGTGLSSDLIASGQPLVIDDLVLQPHYRINQVAGTGKVRSWMGAPLLAGEEVIGLISVQSFEPNAYSKEHLHFLTTLAHHAAVAIENARLFARIRSFNDELERQVASRTEELADANLQLMVEKERLEELYHISHQLSTTLQLDEILNRGLQLVTAVGGVARGAILLRHPASDDLEYRASVVRPGDTAFATHTPWPRDEGLVNWVAQKRQGVLVNDVWDDSRWTASAHWGDDVRAVISVPLLAGEDLMGVLTLAHQEPHYFSDSHYRLVSTVANELSIAIHNATLYEFITEQAERLAGSLGVQEAEASNRKAILESITDGVIVLDAAPEARGHILMLNPAAERLFGMAADVVLGRAVPRGLRDLDLASDVLALMVRLADMAAFDEATPPQVGRQHIGNKVLNLTLSQVVSSQGGIIGVVAVFRDVTKEVEVDRMKSEFISTVAHELRTPMTSIKGYTDLVLMGSVGPVSDMQRQFLNVIRNNADRLSLLVGDMLDLSRIETGRVQLDRQYVDVAALVEDVVASLQTQLAAKEQTLAIDVAPDLPEVNLDRSRVIQVLTNLVSNANKYTPNGGHVWITVRAREGALRVAVRDTGHGIGPRDMERLFTRFFRADNPDVQMVSGTGLGLVIARSLIEIHGGDLWAESELGTGSTFTFTIPLKVSEESVLLAPLGDGTANGHHASDLAGLDELSSLNSSEATDSAAPAADD